MLGFESLKPLPAARPIERPRRSTAGDVCLGLDVLSGRPVTLSGFEMNHSTLIAGRTGSGKSKLVESIVRQLLVNRCVTPEAGAVVVIDPHWSLATHVLNFAAACRMRLPLVVIDPSADLVVGYDPLRSNPLLPKGQTAELAAQWMAHAWNRTGNDDTPLMAAGMKLVVNTILDAGLTSAQIRPLLDPDADHELRFGIVARLRDASLRNKWTALLDLSPPAFLWQMGSTSRAFARFPAHASVMLGQPRSFDFARAIREGWCVFVRAGDLGVGQAIASVVVDDLWNAVQARGEGGSPVHLILDEFTQLCSPQAAAVLAGTRKFNLRCLFVVQSPTQLRNLGEGGRRVFEESKLNALNKIALQLDVDGAAVMAAEMGTDPATLRSMRPRQALVRTATMRPDESAFIRTDELLDFAGTSDEREAYVARRMKTFEHDFVFERRRAEGNLAAAVAELCTCSRLLPAANDSGSEEPDEFTRILRAGQMGL